MVFEKGNKHTKETIKLMKKNSSKYWLDKTLTEEHKEKKRIAMKKWWVEHKNNPKTLERNKKIGLKRKNILHTDEAKEKISKGRLKRKKDLGYLNSPEAREKMSKTRTGYKYSKEHNKKISIARTGTHPSEITKQKMSFNAIERWKDEEYHKQFSESRKGKNNPNYQGGIQYEPYDNNWNNKFKNLIRKRDNQICMNCNIHREKLKYSLDVHHINYDKQLSVKENCISLCHSCHSLTQINRDYWIKLFYHKLSKLYEYKYTNDNKIIFNLESLKGGITKSNVN
jgi:hypothetical protein